MIGALRAKYQVIHVLVNVSQNLDRFSPYLKAGLRLHAFKTRLHYPYVLHVVSVCRPVKNYCELANLNFSIIRMVHKKRCQLHYFMITPHELSSKVKNLNNPRRESSNN